MSRFSTGFRATVLLALLAAAGVVTSGCGIPGEPSPPSLELPARIDSLTAQRTGNAVKLSWRMPTQTTDGVSLKGPVRLEICRAVGTGSCNELAGAALGPGQPGSYLDVLAGPLAHGSTMLLTYRILLLNHSGRSAGPSHPAYSAAGDAPAAVTGLTAEVHQGNVLLTWHSVSERRQVPHGAGQLQPARAKVMRITRLLMEPLPAARHKQGSAKPILPPAEPPASQTLEVPVKGADPGHAIDDSIEMNRRYRYTLVRVVSLALDGQRVEITGQPSDAIVVATTDIFPPPVPTGLAAVADSAGGAVDLSWNPDTAADLAGYFLYRREAGSGVLSRLISPSDHPLTAPAFRDLNVIAGHSYAYSVSAIDESGNESAHSPEVVAKIPGSPGGSGSGQ